jgi:ABC-2 type transport system permease protein
MGLTERRETGMLKRLRATPLPSWALVGGVILNSLVVAFLLTIITVAVGMSAYDVHAPYHYAPLLIGLTLGAVTFCALGIGVSALVRNFEAAPAVVQFPYFLLNFISGVFFPAPRSGFMHDAAQYFPVVHLVNLCFAGFDPRPGAGAVNGSDVASLAIWAAVAVFIAVRRFKWEPRR